MRTLIALAAAALGLACRSSAPTSSTVAVAAPALPTIAVDPLLTAPGAPGSVGFAAFGDTDVRTPEGLQKTGRAVAAVCAAAGCDFIALLGDNIYPLGVTSDTDPAFEATFERPFAGVAAPFYAVLGNHDYGASGGKFLPERAAFQVARSARNAKWRMPAKWWHAVEGPVELFGLDTTAAFYGLDEGQPAELVAWTSSSRAPWKIALGHHPYLSNGPHGNAGTEGKNDAGALGSRLKSFLDGAVCDRVDVYLAGHDHNMEWLQEKCGRTELVVSGASANTYEQPGHNPTRFQASEKLGFLYARASDRALTAHFVGVDGKVLFSRTLTK